MSSKALGRRLREVRDIKGLSLAAVAKPAGMSPTALQKLERGEVDSPSPHRLHKLADQLGVSYADLMELAGYVVPKDGDSDPERDRATMFLQALSSDGSLTDDDLQDVAELFQIKRRQARARED